MVTLRRITESKSNEYRFTEEILTETFPIDEYRDLDEQRKNCDSNPMFHLMIAEEETRIVGFASYWQFEKFCYIEHLAIEPTLRNRGYGKEILNRLQQSVSAIVLEVEKPVDELTERRIGFYERSGFRLSLEEYIQPAYRKDGNELPMHLMFWGDIDSCKNFEETKKAIHRTIYGKAVIE